MYTHVRLSPINSALRSIRDSHVGGPVAYGTKNFTRRLVSGERTVIRLITQVV